MTIGPIVAAVGLLLFGHLRAGDRYTSSVLPAVLLFGLGMVLTVAPLTTTVLSSVPARHSGVASGVNNAVARLAGLIAVAALPAIAGISGPTLAAGLDAGYGRALGTCAGVCAAGGVVAALMLPGRRGSRSHPTRPACLVLSPAVIHPCQDPGAEQLGA